MKLIYIIFILIQFNVLINNTPTFLDTSDFPVSSDDLTQVELKLKVKNESGGDMIILRRGIYTKILLELIPTEIESDNYYLIFKSQASYKLKIGDNNTKVLDDPIILTPSKELYNYTYIGIRCREPFSSIDTIPLKITHLNGSDVNIPIK
jgi:hypothetical protein